MGVRHSHGLLARNDAPVPSSCGLDLVLNIVIAIIATAFLAYAAAAAWLLLHALRRTAQHWPATALAAGGIVLHAIALYSAIHLPGGLNLGVINMFSVMAWQIGVLAFISSLRGGTANLGIGLYPLVGLGVLLLPLNDFTRTMPQRFSWQLEMHILLSVLAYGLLALAAFQAILLAVQDYRLRRRQPGGILRVLPPLAVMENLLFQTLGLGFALLSLALFSGLIFIEDMFAQHLAHKTVLSIFAWIVFAVLLWGRWRFGWRGRVAMRWTLGGFTLLVLAYFGSKLVLELVKGVHWG